MSILDAVRGFIKGLGAALGSPLSPETADDLLEDLFERFPFAAQAQDWLRQNVRLEILNPASTAGGGTWDPGLGLVRLHTAQYEAAIHELAHALWERRRRDRGVRDALVAAVFRLTEDPDPRWERVRALAGHYVHGIADQPGFERGMLLPEPEWGNGGGPRGEWNDWEMFAGLASGCMADIRLLPPYLRCFYEGVFQELPPEAPSPEDIAPHR
jgi:hypothetical protein